MAGNTRLGKLLRATARLAEETGYRDKGSGRFSYDNLNKICQCGHELGEHTVSSCLGPYFKNQCDCEGFEGDLTRG